MKTPTEKQARARRGHACLFTSGDKNGCGDSPEVEIEGVTLRVCARHQALIEAIVADSKKPSQYVRRAA